MRTAAVATVWAVATAVALWIAWRTKVGVVLATVGPRHGLHVGDVAAFVVAYSWAAVATIAVLGRRAR